VMLERMIPGSLGKWQSSLQCLMAGALGPLSFSPVNLWLLGLVSVALLYISLSQSTTRAAARDGWLFGFGWFGVGSSWIYVSINEYSYAGPIVSTLITLLFVAVLALFFSLQCWAWRRFGSRTLPLLGFTASWVLAEWLRSWLFTGFPWLYLGSAHVTTMFSGLAPLFGVFGISYVLALGGAMLGELLLRGLRESPTRKLLRSGLPLGLLLLWAAAWLSNQIDWVQARPDQRPTVGIVQGNIPQGLKFEGDYLQASLDTYESLSEPLWGADLVLWPETAIPMFHHQATTVLDYFAVQASANGSTLVTGIFYNDEGKLHNSLTALGNGSGIWHKQKLVPFGEYVPLRELLSNLLQLFQLPMSSLSPGPAGQDLLRIGGYRVAAFICYEVVYPEFVRQHGRHADFLLTVSNDTWFGDSWGPWQHLQIAAMRTRELGRYMVRATNDGISAIIDERGNILVQTAQFQEDSIAGTIQLFDGSTPFARWGSWPVLIMCALIFLLNGFTKQRKDALTEPKQS